ncbi:MAG: type II secretion system F family protein [Bdellovibrionales bacterium]
MSDLLPIIVAIAVLLLAGLTFAAVVMRKEAQQKKRMVAMIRGNSTANAVVEREGDAQNKRRAEIAKKLKDNKDGDGARQDKTTLSMLLQQAGLSISVVQFWVASVVSMGVFAGLAKLMGQEPLIIGLMAIVGLLGFPRFVVKKLAAKRQKNFLEEFPDALEATVRLLKAGMPVSEAVAMISKEFDGPVGEEMGRIYDQQKIGVPLHEAALAATKRMPLTEMQMFATGMAIQAQTGSSLSEVLMNLSGVIRSRFKLKRKIKALSSEAVASASIIAALPCLVATGLYFVNYDYLSVLWTDSFGKLLLYGAIAWMGVGVMIMKVMINFKI